MTDPHARAVRALGAVFWIAVAVSVVHYADNYFNYSDFPQSVSGPNPSQAVVGLAWFGFTAVGLAGYALVRRDGAESRLALILLAIYSGSGLVGIGHYTVPGALEMPWWRQAHVVADILCGLAILTLVVVVARGRREPATPAH